MSTIVVLEQFAEYHILRCARCNGKGKQQHLDNRGIVKPGWFACGTCNGAGSVKVKVPYTKCAFCGGKGSVQLLDERGIRRPGWSTCQSCRGTGVVSASDLKTY